MENLMSPSEIREFLREKQALLVHFSTVMASNPDLCFPQDLQIARTLEDAPLSFSTIQIGDTGPQSGRGGAEGCFGIVVDVADTTEVLQVAPHDIGSSYHEDLDISFGGGNPPTRKACEESIADRNPSNEWFVRGFKPIGILMLPPFLARKPVPLPNGEISHDDARIAHEEVFAAFEDMRIFIATDESFFEFDRESGRWLPVSYDEIVSPQ